MASSRSEQITSEVGVPLSISSSMLVVLSDVDNEDGLASGSGYTVEASTRNGGSGFEGGRDAHYRLRFAFATADVVDAGRGDREKWKSTFSGTRARKCASLLRAARSGASRIRASCATQWFLQLMEGWESNVGLGTRQRCAYEPRKQRMIDAMRGC